MNWSRTKTIFIITFLFLNVFLTFQLIQKNEHYQISSIPEVTLQERLKTNNITIEGDLPEVTSKDYHIIGRNQRFNEQQLEYLSDQFAEVSEDGKVLTSILNAPYPLSREQFSQDLNQFLLDHVNGGAHYQYGGRHKELMHIYFYQTFNQHTAYSDNYEPLTIKLNDDWEIIGYSQRFIEFEQHGSESEILSSLKAVEVLLNSQLLNIGDTINKIEYGYYNRFSLENDDLMYAPMWLIEVGEESYLVHAIEGDVQHLTVDDAEEE
ncbi:two-component system regulatory protein YycI [Alkalihalobacillus sp. 1P02AB]|uniref:two-component system regulatory protein YycI n=1 Tax=Alkalihalobacillus sp. 1P02AB TaxID=3132260 RepID=UPI0039A62CD0